MPYRRYWAENTAAGSAVADSAATTAVVGSAAGSAEVGLEVDSAAAGLERVAIVVVGRVAAAEVDARPVQARACCMRRSLYPSPSCFFADLPRVLGPLGSSLGAQ
jgi:hypothetical protein